MCLYSPYGTRLSMCAPYYFSGDPSLCTRYDEVTTEPFTPLHELDAVAYTTFSGPENFAHLSGTGRWPWPIRQPILPLYWEIEADINLIPRGPLPQPWQTRQPIVPRFWDMEAEIDLLPRRPSPQPWQSDLAVALTYPFEPDLPLVEYWLPDSPHEESDDLVMRSGDVTRLEERSRNPLKRSWRKISGKATKIKHRCAKVKKFCAISKSRRREKHAKEMRSISMHHINESTTLVNRYRKRSPPEDEIEGVHLEIRRTEQGVRYYQGIRRLNSQHDWVDITDEVGSRVWLFWGPDSDRVLE
ncbi:hypothetical protein L228DRAFT_236549 [Xylona heveae TC161]|uniref:Uncharacterized protein n=1 Tax=Xylona heveae (strain CBS 132557 / TC161) TaxID=1328760 RepID=A0A165IVV5_XYLHT|nr:hypothetical protein L228DRAFT_236549 [Xylona heveae TC161]KZF25453.1 hypothetical protein L228DRAFT_236549 [Xylona heveae TC161]